MSEGLGYMEPCLECFQVNRTRLVEYHERLLTAMQDVTSKNPPPQWNRMFALDVRFLYLCADEL